MTTAIGLAIAMTACNLAFHVVAGWIEYVRLARRSRYSSIWAVTALGFGVAGTAAVVRNGGLDIASGVISLVALGLSIPIAYLLADRLPKTVFLISEPLQPARRRLLRVLWFLATCSVLAGAAWYLATRPL